MKPFGWVLCLLSFAGLTACEQNASSMRQKSDYTGNFYTAEGQCPESAELSVSLGNKHVDITFFCFIRACYTAKAKLSPSGFFEMRKSDYEFLHGRLSAERATGNWTLVINGEKCKGRFEADRMQPQ